VRFLLAFIYILFGGVFANAAAPKRPNIVFLFSDDHASHAISAYGSKINQTPNIDRIAKEGMLFRNTFCTNSICGPSRAVILTGKHSHINGFYDNRSTFDGTQQTFAKLLQANGYNTAMIGNCRNQLRRSNSTGHWGLNQR
jgi:N-acetylglucosamine-6-sulfatase